MGVVSDNLIATVEELTFDAGRALMIERGYDVVDFVDRWRDWLVRGDIVIIFENSDLGHYDIGNVTTMPWYSDLAAHPLPRHMPDHTSVGLGWRYITRYIVREES